MSETQSVSAKCPLCRRRICQFSGKPRSSFYYAPVPPTTGAPGRRGPKPNVSDADVLSSIRRVLRESPFLGEGHRKVHARLKWDGVAVGRDRVLRIMAENELLAPHRAARELGPRVHEGIIQTETTNEMWGTDLTFTSTEEDGSVAVFIAVDHCNTECVGIHASSKANRFEAFEPVRQGLRTYFETYGKDCAQGLSLRHDHGSQYISKYFQTEISFLGIKSSPSFVRSPEGNGISERFIRTLKEQLLWINRFKNLEELTVALQQFKTRYNEQWLVQRHSHRSPIQIRNDLLAAKAAA